MNRFSVLLAVTVVLALLSGGVRIGMRDSICQKPPQT